MLKNALSKFPYYWLSCSLAICADLSVWGYALLVLYYRIRSYHLLDVHLETDRFVFTAWNMKGI